MISPESRLTRYRSECLRSTALRVRRQIVRMATDGGCFIGASLSCADLLVYLYAQQLRITPSTVDDPGRDFLLLSKGHDVPALYAVLAEQGFIESDRLKNHLSTEDHIYWHPNRAIPGIEFHSGSLGHLLSVGIGIALEARMRRGGNRVYVIVGDGELNEGSIWEGALVAAAHRLDNLVLIVDRNGFQANARTEELIPLEPIDEKFRAFGWRTRRVDGQSFEALDGAFEELQHAAERPSVIIADTMRGCGCPSIEGRADRWFVNLSHDDVERLLAELDGGVAKGLETETLMVR